MAKKSMTPSERREAILKVCTGQAFL